MNLEKIDRYTIIRELGRGGMATVYLAHDPRFGRDVAIKILPLQASDETSRGRFQREARTIAALEHPAIAPVYDFGEDNGQLFLVMRVMTGGSLADRIRQGSLPLAEAGVILQRIASALDYAHRQGVIHRDLKPANILFDQHNTAFLADFGIAKLMEAQASYTGSAIIGTPAYISPEQVQGNRTIDGRADIYALGAILYEMLTGRMPYQADTPFQVLMKHALEPPPRILEANATLPPYVQEVIDRAMAKNPDDRLPTAGAMVTALLDPAKLPATMQISAPTPPATARPSIPIRPAPVLSTPTVATPVVARRRGRTAFWLVGSLMALVFISGAFAMAYLAGSGYFSRTPTPTAPSPSLTPLAVAEATEEVTETVAVEATEGGEIAAATPTFTPAPSFTPEGNPSPTLASSPTASPTPTPTSTTTSRPTNTFTPRPTNTQAPSATPTTNVPSAPGVVYNFESGSVNWRRGDQPYGEFVRSAEQVHGGGSAGKLTYDFPAVADNFVVFLAQPSINVGGEPTGITAWVYGDGSGHFLNLWLQDADGEVRQYTFGRISYEGWAQVTAWFDEERGWPNQHISGTDDGRLAFPARLQAIVWDGSPDEQASNGAIFIDDLATTNNEIP